APSFTSCTRCGARAKSGINTSARSSTPGFAVAVARSGCARAKATWMWARCTDTARRFNFWLRRGEERPEAHENTAKATVEVRAPIPAQANTTQSEAAEARIERTSRNATNSPCVALSSPGDDT